MTKSLTPSQVNQITHRLSDTTLAEVWFVNEVDGRVWHVRSNSPFGRNVFMRPDYQLVDTIVCEDFRTFDPILSAWFGDEVNGDGTVTGMIFLPNDNITFITYDGYGMQGLWAMMDTAQLMQGVIVEHETKTLYNIGKR